MRGSFLFNIILALIINLMIKPLYIFGIEIPVQNVVGHEAYGMYFTFLNLGFIFQILADAGLQNHVSTHLPPQRERSRQLFSSSLVLKGGLALLFMLSVGLAGYLLGYWALDSRLFAVVLVNVILISLMQHLRAFISGLGHYVVDTLCSVLDKVLLIIVVGQLIYFSADGVSIHRFAAAQTITLLTTIVIMLYILRKDIGWEAVSMMQMRAHLIEAIPFGIIIALMFLYTRIDAIMIEQLLIDGSYQAGLYASAYRIYDIIVMLFYLFAPLLLPMMARLSGSSASLRSLYLGSLRINQVAVCLVAWGVALFAPFIMEVLYTDYVSTTSDALRIFMVALVFKAGSFVTSTLLTSQQQFAGMIKLFILTIVVNVVLNLICIPSMGILGAAWATAITQAWMGIGLLWLCHRSHARGHWSTYVLMVAMMLVAGGVYYLFHEMPKTLTTLGLIIGVNIGLFGLWVGVDHRRLTQLLGDLER